MDFYPVNREYSSIFLTYNMGKNSMWTKEGVKKKKVKKVKQHLKQDLPA